MHGFDGYMRHAYPSDKVSFLLISAAGSPSMPSIPTSYVILSANCIRKESRDQCNCLFTLVDSLDSIAVLFTVNRQIIAGKDAFIDAVQKVTEQISFEHDLFVDVPLLTTRVLGGLVTYLANSSSRHISWLLSLSSASVISSTRVNCWSLQWIWLTVFWKQWETPKVTWGAQ